MDHDNWELGMALGRRVSNLLLSFSLYGISINRGKMLRKPGIEPKKL